MSFQDGGNKEFKKFGWTEEKSIPGSKSSFANVLSHLGRLAGTGFADNNQNLKKGKI
jgi:hypothetical protein